MRTSTPCVAHLFVVAGLATRVPEHVSTMTGRGCPSLAVMTLLAWFGSLAAGGLAQAAEPARATISWGETVEWTGGPLRGEGRPIARPPLGQCPRDLCDEFLLEVNVAPSPNPNQIRFVQIDLDLSEVEIFIVPPGGDPPRDTLEFDRSAARLLDPDTGTWVIRLVCKVCLEASTYTGTATTGAVEMPPAVSHRAGASFLGLRGDVRGRVHPVGATAFEPTIGITEDGSIFYQALLFGSLSLSSSVLRSTDQGAGWVRVSPELGPVGRHPDTRDPYLHVDRDTSRVFSVDYTPTFACHELSFTDDAGGSWTTTVICGATDFEKVFTGRPAISPTVGYPNVVYFCASNGGLELDPPGGTSGMPTCLKSLDGGLTFVPTGAPPFADEPERTDGYGLYGHCTGHVGPGAVGPDGTLYVPRGGCGQPQVAISHDEGTTWERVQVADNGIARDTRFVADPLVGWEFPNPQETAVATDQDGNVYYVWTARDRLPYLALSTDKGRTWGEPMMIAPPGVKETGHVDVDARAPGQVALAYMGSENSPGPPFPGEKFQCEERFQNICMGASFTEDPDEAYEGVTWNGYITVSDNVLTGDPRFLSAPVNDPTDPFVCGRCGPRRCAEAGDFFDVKIAPDGTPWAAFVDACPRGLNTDRGFGQGIAGRLVGRP